MKGQTICVCPFIFSENVDRARDGLSKKSRRGLVNVRFVCYTLYETIRDFDSCNLEPFRHIARTRDLLEEVMPTDA